MNCREVEPLLDAYLDGELDPVHTLEVDAHRAECAACGAALKSRRQLAAAVASAPYYPAPPELRTRLEHSAARRWNRPILWLAFAAGLAALALVTQRPDPLEKEVVQAHVRSLLADHLLDVPAAGHHTVKPWLAAKLDFALDVEDISARGFALAGGRLDYLDGHPVAALVYRHDKHVINVFVWPAARQPDSRPVAKTSGNLNIVRWRADGMNWWAVSDLSLIELGKLPLSPCFLPAHETLRG